MISKNLFERDFAFFGHDPFFNLSDEEDDQVCSVQKSLSEKAEKKVQHLQSSSRSVVLNLFCSADPMMVFIEPLTILIFFDDLLFIK